MFKNKDVLLIKNIDSEYIDKVIIILNEKHKNVVPEDRIIKQAEKIVDDYMKKQYYINTANIKKKIALFTIISTFIILMFSTLCLYFIS